MKTFSRLNNLLWLLPLGFLALFYFYPLGSILALSFARGEGGLLQALAEVLGNASQRGVIWFSIWQAALSTLLTLLIGLPAAGLLARFNFRGKAFLRALSGIPFVLPTLVVAAAFHALLGPRGWLNLGLMELFQLDSPPIHFVNSLTAILVAHVFYNTTIVLRMVGDFWARLDLRVEQAARSLGASAWQSFRKVTLPLLMPAIAAAALLVFIFNFTSFGVILVLGGPQFATMEVEIYYQTIGLFNLPLAAILALIQLGSTLALSLIYTRLSRSISRPVALRTPHASSMPLGRGRASWWAAGFLVLLALFFVLPLGSLAARSVSRIDAERRQRGEVDRGLTLDYYRALTEDDRGNLFYAPPSKAIGTSLLYAGATMGLALAVGLPAALVLSQRKESFVSKWLDPLLMLPLGTSAVTLGLGFIIALDSPPLDLRASPLLVPLAHTLVALPFVVRSLLPSLRSIQPQLRQSAALLGASPAKVLRYVDAPLVGRALMVSAIFAFTISLGEFGATALIARPEFPTIPVMIFRLLGQPGALNYGQAMALSTLLMLVSAGGMLMIERLRFAEVGEF